MRPRQYFCHRAENSITIDGNLTKPAWDAASWTDDFVDIEGDKKPAPQFRTRAKMLWDDDYLYVAAELEEPNLWATITDPNTPTFDDNDFEIFVDPDGDCQNYVEIEINALGTVWDLFLPKPYRAGGVPLTGWNIDGMKSAVMLHGTLNDFRDTDTSWTIEFAIPWRAFRDESRHRQIPKVGDAWQINFSRVQWETEEIDGRIQKIAGKFEHNWVWSPQHVVDMHRPLNWGLLVFCADGLTPEFEDDSEVRSILGRVFDAQVAYRLQHGRFADLDELPQIVEFNKRLQVERTTHQFMATLDSDYKVWTIDQDSHFARVYR